LNASLFPQFTRWVTRTTTYRDRHTTQAFALLDVGGRRTPRRMVGVARRSRTGGTQCAASYGDGRFVGPLVPLSVANFRAVRWTV
jgi:hypothetical protein